MLIYYKFPSGHRKISNCGRNTTIKKIAIIRSIPSPIHVIIFEDMREQISDLDRIICRKSADILGYLRKHSLKSRLYGHIHRLNVCILRTSYQDADHKSKKQFGFHMVVF